MGSREPAVMGFESRGVIAQITNHFVTVLEKHVIKGVISLPVSHAIKYVIFVINT